MAFMDDLFQMISEKEKLISPDDMDWINYFVNDEEERAKLEMLFDRLIKQTVEHLGQELAKQESIEVPDEFSLVQTAGTATVAGLVALARVAGIVSERQRNTALAEQLGAPDGGRNS